MDEKQKQLVSKLIELTKEGKIKWGRIGAVQWDYYCVNDDIEYTIGYSIGIVQPYVHLDVKKSGHANYRILMGEKDEKDGFDFLKTLYDLAAHGNELPPLSMDDALKSLEKL